MMPLASPPRRALRHPFRAVATAVAVGLLTAAAPTAAGAATRLPAPRPATPAGDAKVTSVPSFSWAPVKGAERYEFQLSADPDFKSIVLGTGGSFMTQNTAATVDKSLADGAYSWRVRAISGKRRAGRWSVVRSVVKRWLPAPELIPGTADTRGPYPTAPVVLRWKPVPNAYKYRVILATDPQLAHSALGDRSLGWETTGTSLTLPVTVAPGDYYWAVTPLDDEKHPGAQSAVAQLDWTWKDGGRVTGLVWTDLNDAPQVVDPRLSWNGVEGASRYEVEINSSASFSPGSKVCCTEIVTGTKLSPRNVLPNDDYHWRVRAFDVDANAGPWSVGPDFAKDFDRAAQGAATIPGLKLVRHPFEPSAGTLNGAPLVSYPVVSWDPVPGASSYELQGVPYSPSVGCNWSASIPQKWDVVTAATGWTPLSPSWNGGKPGGISYPRVGYDPSPFGGAQSGTSYCVRVAAQSDRDVRGKPVVSDWTYLNGTAGPAFSYQAPPPPALSGTLITPVDAYLSPQEPPAQQGTTGLPLFTWKPVDGARSYFVVVAKDASFTDVVDVALTQMPAYAPRNGNLPLTYPDESPYGSTVATPYHWAVVPAADANGNGAPTSPRFTNPHVFDKQSVAPRGITEPADATGVGQPTFRWTPVPDARSYVVQVAADNSFANPIETVTTSATSYTSTAVYPPDTHLFWRVRANDENLVGLAWSDTYGFTRTLPAPVVKPVSGDGPENVPVLSWTPVQGAVSYDVHFDQPDGTRRDFTVRAPVFTPTTWYGTGYWHWKVRANFRLGFQYVSSAYVDGPPFMRRIAAVSGLRRTTLDGGGAVLAWDSAAQARMYKIQIATDDSFSNLVEQATTDNTSYAPKMTATAYRDRSPLFWRVAVVDEGLNQGGWSTGALRSGARLSIKVVGRLRARRAGTVRVLVRDARRHAVPDAMVSARGAGVSRAGKRTGKSGTVVFRLKPGARGIVKFTVKKAGYGSGSATLRVR